MKCKGTLSSFYPHWWEIVCEDVKVFWVPLTVCDQTGKPPSWEDLYNITEVALSRFPAFSYLISWQVLVGNSSDVGSLCSAKLNILFSTIWVSQFRRLHLDIYCLHWLTLWHTSQCFISTDLLLTPNFPEKISFLIFYHDWNYYGSNPLQRMSRAFK